ncbi:MAG: NUDIX pyrophosphatase [Chloroflexota bacterium]|nr:NUDIX pyrophosphatase [Chloroflexota bacterium]
MSENETRTHGWPPHRVSGVDVWPYRLHDGQAEFLLMHRVAGEDPPFWQGVSGWIEANEPPHETALRELREETGLEAEALFTVDAIFDLYKWQRGTVETIVPFAAQVVDGVDPILSEEHDEWRWSPLAEARELLPYEPQREALRRIFEDLLERPGSAPLYRIDVTSERPEKTR